MSCALDARSTTTLVGGTPQQVTTLLTGRAEYFLLIDNPSYKSGPTVYIVASTSDAGPNALEIPPRSQVLSGPYTDDLPCLYSSEAASVYCSVLAYAQPSGVGFVHEISSMDTVLRAAPTEYTHSIVIDVCTAAAHTQLFALPGFPTNVFVSHAYIECDTDFAGGGAASCTAIVGDAGNDNELVEAVSVFTGASNVLPLTADGDATKADMVFEAAYAPLCTIAADVNVADLTAGQLTVHIVYITCPFDA